MRKTRQPLATCNMKIKKDLKTLPMDCYALTRLPGSRLSQIAIELAENKPLVRASLKQNARLPDVPVA